jgi:glucokinase
MQAPARQVLLGDIGGTNARFALLTDGDVGAVQALRVEQFPGVPDAIDRFLGQHARPAIASAVFAAAGPCDRNRITVTNSGWVIDGAAIAAAFGFATVSVINDFVATGWSLPLLAAGDLMAIGGGRAVPDAPMVAIGPGTGLGLTCHVPGPHGASVIASEGGHADLPAASDREDAVIRILRARFGHVSAERAISGPGLENLYQAIATIDGAAVPERHAAAITDAALDHSCPVSVAALEMFCSMLGKVAGNAALCFGSRGGVYIAGGIAPRIAGFVAQSQFRAAFEARGRLRSYAQSIPTSVILHPDTAFLGLRALAMHQEATAQASERPAPGQA